MKSMQAHHFLSSYVSSSLCNGKILEDPTRRRAFLHAPLGNQHVYIWPPKEYYPEGTTLWRLKKAMYGLRSSPKAWQDYFAKSMTELGFRRLLSMTSTSWSLSMTLWSSEILQRWTRSLRRYKRRCYSSTPDTWTRARSITFSEDRFTTKETTLTSSSTTTTSKQHYKRSTWLSAIQHLDQVHQQTDLHSQTQNHSPRTNMVYRRVVGKLQWLSFTRPNISYSTKELARGLHQRTEADWKKAKHLLIYSDTYVEQATTHNNFGQQRRLIEAKQS